MAIEAERSIIPDIQIERVHANANFGVRTKRDVVREGVLKSAFGWHMGSTMRSIIREHGLSQKNGRLTQKGFRYLRAMQGSATIGQIMDLFDAEDEDT